MREIKPKTFKFGKEQKEKSLENIVFSRLLGGGGCGIRTHVTVLSNGFQDRLVMTTSITLRKENCEKTARNASRKVHPMMRKTQ